MEAVSVVGVALLSVLVPTLLILLGGSFAWGVFLRFAE